MRLSRPAQIAMLQGLSRSQRNMLVAGMGTGKTGGALLHAGGLEMQYGRWPGMFVLAPLQVALNWRTEIPLWRPDLRVSLIAGTKADREKAIKANADVYIMGYDNLPWLHTYGPTNWNVFGDYMVCDESTRLRATRVHTTVSKLGKHTLHTGNSGVQTGALAKHAADFPYWLNMTGTPCPNGPLDWWAQMWFIDGGARLGNSFTAYENRWFMKPTWGGEFAKSIPQPGAVEQITDLIKDVVTIVRTEDYFDLDKPNIVNREVELPEKVMRQYKDMKTKMFLTIQKDLEDHTINVQSAASKVSKLLQIAAGFTYYRDEDEDPDLQLCEELHSAKVDAVESILNETDENLVVFYQHKATLQLLQKKFKKRIRELDKAGAAMADWNAGKVEILACQYQRGGMGISLQHGGRNVCFIEPTYRADDYEQAIERLGPMRQMQSGYNRTVNVFRVVARGTEDMAVYEKVAGKITLQDLIVDLLKGK